MIVWIIQIKNIKYENKKKQDVGHHQPQRNINTDPSFHKKYNKITYVDEGNYHEAHDVPDGNDSGSDGIVICPIPYQQRE